MYLGLDTEHGGFHEESTLLDVYAAHYDKDFNKVNYVSLKLMPDNGVYSVNGKAMEVNKIDLAKHTKSALTYSQGQKKLGNLLFEAQKANKGRLMVIGHCVAGDIELLKKTITNDRTWDGFVDYHMLDTAVIAKTLMVAGILPHGKLGLEALCNTYGIVNKAPHTAKGDVEATVELYKYFINLLRNIHASAYEGID